MHVEDISSLKLDQEIKQRAINVNDCLYVIEGEFEEDFEILKMLQRSVMEEKVSKSFEREGQSFLLLFDIKKEKFIGFIVWVKNINYKDFSGSDILKQIYITKSERNNGYGTKFLKFWVDNYANKVNGRFGISLCIDSPLIPFLVRLGYAERINDRIKPIKFYVSPRF